MADLHSFQEKELQPELGEIIAKHSKNSKKTTRRATSAIWRIFAELDKHKCTLSRMN